MSVLFVFSYCNSPLDASDAAQLMTPAALISLRHLMVDPEPVPRASSRSVTARNTDNTPTDLWRLV